MNEAPTWLAERDPLMAKLVRSIHLPPLQPDGQVWRGLLRSIIHQQLSVKAAATIEGRFWALLPAEPGPADVLRLDVAQLRSAGLSQQKSGYVRAIATHFEAGGEADWASMDDEAIIAELCQIKGVGRWTAQMLLMFSLGRPDVFPDGDLGIVQGMVRLYGLNAGQGQRHLLAELRAIAEAWRPQRSLACRYLWAAKDAGY